MTLGGGKGQCHQPQTMTLGGEGARPQLRRTTRSHGGLRGATEDHGACEGCEMTTGHARDERGPRGVRGMRELLRAPINYEELLSLTRSSYL